jgi:hypothetical protein
MKKELIKIALAAALTSVMTACGTAPSAEEAAAPTVTKAVPTQKAAPSQVDFQGTWIETGYIDMVISGSRISIALLVDGVNYGCEYNLNSVTGTTLETTFTSGPCRDVPSWGFYFLNPARTQLRLCFADDDCAFLTKQ